MRRSKTFYIVVCPNPGAESDRPGDAKKAGSEDPFSVVDVTKTLLDETICGSVAGNRLLVGQRLLKLRFHVRS